MKFWLDKGADGFRMDVIPFISKQQSFSELSGRFEQTPLLVDERRHELNMIFHFDVVRLAAKRGDGSRGPCPI
jgi:oligo-1,6-glucosidase